MIKHFLKKRQNQLHPSTSAFIHSIAHNTVSLRSQKRIKILIHSRHKKEDLW